jgi:hypothetical protein
MRKRSSTVLSLPACGDWYRSPRKITQRDLKEIKKKESRCRVTPVIPATWRAEIRTAWAKKSVRPHLNRKSWAWWHRPAIPVMLGS